MEMTAFFSHVMVQSAAMEIVTGKVMACIAGDHHGINRLRKNPLSEPVSI